jgi:hypothetical protein
MRQWQLFTALGSAALSLAALAADVVRQPLPPMKLCIEGSGDCTIEPPPSVNLIKWNPGHYLRVAEDEVLSGAELDILRSIGPLKGIEMDYLWRTLEPQRGEYDFSLIDRHLGQLRPLGKRLIIRVIDRSFGSVPSLSELLPSYLANEPGGFGGWYNKGEEGVVARVWVRPIADRKIALLRALAARYDRDPNVEAIVANNESSPGAGVSPGNPEDYTRAAQAAQVKRIAEAAVAAWPHTVVISRLNHLVDEMPQLVEHHYSNRIGWGGPDVAPEPHNDTLASRIIRAVEPGFTVSYCGAVASSYVAASTPYTGGKDGSFTAEQFYDHARNKLRATHISWVRRETGSAPWSRAIVPVILANPTVNSSCPAQYRNRCNTSG